MEFDKALVYTALNADELKAGDLVILADRITELRSSVENDADAKRLFNIGNESEEFRFWAEHETYAVAKYRYAYLVERASNKVMKPMCSGNVQFRPFNDVSELIEAWRAKTGYHSTGCTMPPIWIKHKQNEYIYSVVVLFSKTVVLTGLTCAITMDELFYNFVFLDDMPCGICVCAT